MSMSHDSDSAGQIGSTEMAGRRFPWIQLLVVVGILGLLCALLSPAIHRGRGRRVDTCRNNMRGVVTAVVAFEAKMTIYPGFAGRLDGFERPLMFVLLPEMERNDIYNAFRSYGADGLPAEADSLYFEFLQCPENPRDRMTAAMAFIFNTGMPDVEQEPHDLPANGVFFRTPKFGSKYLAEHDGMTNTLLISERIAGPPWTSRQEYEIGMVWHPRYAKWRLPPAGDPYYFSRPSSHHKGYVNVAFADSHVRALSNDIDYRVYAQLLTSNGAEAQYADTLEWVPAEFRQPLAEGAY